MIDLEVGSLKGFMEARLHSELLEGSTRGFEVIEFAKEIGMPLLPWQEWAMVDLCAIDDEGKWKRKLAGVLVARQNGKTHFAAMRILAGLFLFDEKQIVAMSSNRLMARDTFKKVARIINDVPRLKEQTVVKGGQVGRWANGQEEIVLKNGAEYRITAATRDGSRGLSADLLYLDELREISPEAWSAATYTTNARPNAQTLVTSNAGDATSIVLSDLRMRALTSKSNALGWYEWSADPKRKVTDRKAWQQANPSLGYLIDESVLANHVATDDPDAVRTEMLCQWITTTEAVFRDGIFEACTDPDLVMEPGNPTWMAIDIAPHRRSAALVGAQLLGNGKIGVGMMQSWVADNNVEDTVIASEVAEWARKYRAQVVAFDRFATSAIAAKLAASGIQVEDVSGGRFAQACDELLSSVTHKKLVHSGQPELIEQILSCAAKPVGDGGWRIVRRKSAGDVNAAIALAMVVHFAVRPRNTPQIIEI
jgi:phage terminase large subunit-like protein